MIRIKQVASCQNTEEYVKIEDITELTDAQLESLAESIQREQEARKWNRFANQCAINNMNYGR